MNNPNNKILVYTFYNWKKESYKFLRKTEIPNVNIMYIQNVAQAYKLAKHISLRQYKVILGIADNNRRAKRHRYESIFINKYGKNPIIKDAQEIETPTLDIPESDCLYHSKNFTNGPCNRSAFLIARSIRTNCLETKFAFIHVNKNLTNEELLMYMLKWIS